MESIGSRVPLLDLSAVSKNEESDSAPLLSRGPAALEDEASTKAFFGPMRGRRKAFDHSSFLSTKTITVEPEKELILSDLEDETSDWKKTDAWIQRIMLEEKEKAKRDPERLALAKKKIDDVNEQWKSAMDAANTSKKNETTSRVKFADIVKEDF
jgi:predicted AlkP superfamily phosphohydrolase/phosphomutase